MRPTNADLLFFFSHPTKLCWPFVYLVQPSNTDLFLYLVQPTNADLYFTHANNLRWPIFGIQTPRSGAPPDYYYGHPAKGHKVRHTKWHTYLVWAVYQEHPRKDKLHRMLAGLHSGSAASVFDSIDPKECAWEEIPVWTVFFSLSALGESNGRRMHVQLCLIRQLTEECFKEYNSW